MTQVIEDPNSQHEAGPDDRPEAHKGRKVRPSVLAVIGLVIVIVAAFALRTAGNTPTTKPSFATGSTIPIAISCGGADAACVAGTTAADGTVWMWVSGVGQTIPTAWLGREIPGEIHIEAEWGSSTFVAGGQSLTVQGGRATPGHSLFG